MIHGEHCQVFSHGLSGKVNLCTCIWAALEAKAAKWDALCDGLDEKKYHSIREDELLALRADAATWRHLAPTLRQDIEAARRWRTVERAVEDGIDIALHMDSHGGVEVTYDGDHLSGPTLAAAADALHERMDKEGK